MLLLIGMVSVRIHENKCVLKIYFECDSWKIPEQSVAAFFSQTHLWGQKSGKALVQDIMWILIPFLTTIGRVKKENGKSDNTLASL